MTDKITQELEDLDTQIADLEREAAGLPPVPTFEELQEAGAIQKLQQREARRGVVPYLLRAAKIKRLELQRKRLEDKIPALDEQRQTGYERLEAAREARRQAANEETSAYQAWYDAHHRIETFEQHIKQLNHEIRDLRQGGNDGQGT